MRWVRYVPPPGSPPELQPTWPDEVAKGLDVEGERQQHRDFARALSGGLVGVYANPPDGYEPL